MSDNQIKPSITFADLEEIGVPKALMIEFLETPGHQECVLVVEAVMDAIINANERQVIRLMHDATKPPDVHELTIFKGRLSLAKKLKLVFNASLDMLSTNESANR